ncbi:hypothetical protein JIG36_31600 [Actinoplanes sp. LDG1-06]|uniref:Uncharacterized protein n=1 Tax=Paractinoplanes ovalisporus TaxID=2810368 RepID=A0ABS2AJN9_9ACTN|nr:hypothetical protein [Actinoplanes ovalisporus]MBM2620068.1 hypothetical protein [Actinoplanes ovalisporus]
MTRLRGTLMAAAVPLFLLAACAQPGTDAGAPGSGSPRSASAYPQSGDELVARVESYGGFVPPDRTVGTLPSISVYADGRVITEGPVPAIYPGPAMPNLQVLTLSPDQVQQLLKEASDAGVKPGTDFGQPNVADAPTTRVTVRNDQGTTQSVAVVALNEAQANDPMLTDAQESARATLAAYVKKLQELAAGDGATASTPYVPESLAVLARPWTQQSGGEPAQAEMAWPGPALPGDYLNPAVKIGCVVVSGADLDKVTSAAKKANQMTPWTADGQKYLINFRPLLPDEKGCAEFKGNR